MSIEVGTKVTGKVTGITNFGAFVELEGGKQVLFISVKLQTAMLKIFMIF